MRDDRRRWMPRSALAFAIAASGSLGISLVAATLILSGCSSPHDPPNVQDVVNGTTRLRLVKVCQGGKSQIMRDRDGALYFYDTSGWATLLERLDVEAQPSEVCR